MSPWFDIQSGVKLGCQPGCSIYIWSLQGVKQSGMRVKVGNMDVNYLLYADDAEFIATSECELQTLVTTLKEDCESNGLSLNENNTKVLVLERN